jgi:hypothetical protein
MGYEFAAFHAPQEIVRTPFFPAFKCCGVWKPIEGGIEFNGVELPGIVLKPFRFGQFVRIKDLLPVIVHPS